MGPLRAHRCAIRLALAVFPHPFVVVATVSLSEITVAVPPELPVIEWGRGGAGLWEAVQHWSLSNYSKLVDETLYWQVYLSSLRIAFISTLLTVLVGFPIAYAMARAPRSWQPILVMMVILPFWTSYLIRAYAWIGILRTDGLLNQALMSVGVINEPLLLLNTTGAVYIGIIYTYLPSWSYHSILLWRGWTQHSPKPPKIWDAHHGRPSGM